MAKYNNGCIYKLVRNDDYDNENIYIGSTTNFKTRKNQHKTVSNNPNSPVYNHKIYQYIRKTGGFENWYMVQIEPFPCNSKKELETRERYWVEQFKSKLNCRVPTQTIKEWRESNKETILQHQKEYRKDNKEKIAEYYENNKEKIAEKKAEYYQNNKDKILEERAEYRKNNKEKVAEKVTCSCGCQVNNSSLLKHQKTAKHLKIMRLSGKK